MCYNLSLSHEVYCPGSPTRGVYFREGMQMMAVHHVE